MDITAGGPAPTAGVKESLGEVDIEGVLLFCAAEPGRPAPENGRGTVRARRKAGGTFESRLESQRFAESASLLGLEPALLDMSASVVPSPLPSSLISSEPSTIKNKKIYVLRDN